MFFDVINYYADMLIRLFSKMPKTAVFALSGAIMMIVLLLLHPVLSVPLILFHIYSLWLWWTHLSNQEEKKEWMREYKANKKSNE